MKKRMTFGVVAAECSREYTSQVLGGIIEQGFACNADIFILSAVNNFQPPVHTQKLCEADIYKLALSDCFDGFIYDRNYIYNKDIVNKTDALLKSTGKPVITLDSAPHKYFDNIVSHDYEAFGRLAEHLITDHGYKNIFCLTGPKDYTQSEERLRAFIDTMKKHRLRCDSSCYEYGDFWKDSPQRLARKIAAGKIQMPEAVMCANDVMAETLIEELLKCGIRVPEDIAVTGYDCSDSEEQTVNWLTTYQKNGFSLGAEAVRKLYSKLTGKSCRRVFTKPDSPIIGCSCGCAVNARANSIPRDRKMKKIYADRLLQSNMLFDLLHCTTVPELLITLSGYIHLIYGWRRFRLLLTEPYLRLGGRTSELKFDPDVSIKELQWCDAARDERLDTSPFPLWQLPQHLSDSRFPAAYYINPLHINDSFYGIAALSFGKKPRKFDKSYIHFLNFITAALDQLQSRAAYKRSRDNGAVESTQLYEALCELRNNMHDTPEREWSIDAICKSINVSRSYLQRMYRQFFGRSIFEELISCRIEKAKRLLIKTSSSVSEIAELCGYASYNHFVRQFRSYENMTPTEYRKRSRSGRGDK